MTNRTISFKFVGSGMGMRILKPVIYKHNGLRSQPQQNRDYSIQSGDSSVWLGVPAVAKLLLKYGNTTIELEDAILTVQQSKNIVRTILAGRNGSIKEFISEGDYDVTITAGLYDTSVGGYSSDIYPKEAVEAFIELLKAQEALDVTSEFLSLFGITKLVVTQYNMNQETHTNRQTIVVTCISDEDYLVKKADE